MYNASDKSLRIKGVGINNIQKLIEYFEIEGIKNDNSNKLPKR